MTDGLDMNPSNALDTVISTMLFAMSTIRSIMAKCTWLALTPLRFSWNMTTWIISNTISIVVTIATYPPVTTLLMVIGCGLLIGACAGFGVELITSMVLSATWGKEKKAINDPVMDIEGEHDDVHQPIEQQDDMYDDEVVEMRLGSKKSKHDLFDDMDEDDDDGNEDPQDNHEADDAMYELLQHHLASVASNTNSDDNTQLRRRTPH
ncbi:hypothetical protein O0I10_009798 [Lichtheimia ornata]|uniref:Uncharacterized protein n=1 Tax=Lichtheimia ornata TaxID=688661 RepID=A0AAD7UW51_9FUNG|nr:uncharacterized protein O0I10_009798 [Lichtheimia ornata]KAJ8654492.1 hypothetical protein O0I10_009798 [Lichtheimia ornata]